MRNERQSRNSKLKNIASLETHYVASSPAHFQQLSPLSELLLLLLLLLDLLESPQISDWLFADTQVESDFRPVI